MMAIELTHTYQTESSYDVIVCGGGPAGTAAALAAARHGARTLLIEQGGCLGGFWTQGLLTWLIDTENKDGLINELMSRLEQHADGRKISSPKRFTADTEKTKLTFETMCQEAGVTVLYHTVVTGAIMDGHRIQYVLTASKSGHIAYGAQCFVDATGDGDLGFFAGANYTLGNENGTTQPLSLIGHFTGVSLSDIEPFDSRKGPGRKPAILQEFAEAGFTPTYRAPLIAVLSEKNELYGLMINHEYRNGLSSEALTQGTFSGRAEIHRCIDALRAKGGIWKNIRLISTSDSIGVREGRRIHGLYTLTESDVREGRRFDDGICTVYGAIDVHNLKPGSEETDRKKYGSRHDPYQIPYRCLVSADVENLLMGGRCISGDFIAHSSYRVAGPAFRTGEIAGLAAAHCALRGTNPAQISPVDFLK